MLRAGGLPPFLAAGALDAEEEDFAEEGCCEGGAPVGPGTVGDTK